MVSGSASSHSKPCAGGRILGAASNSAVSILSARSLFQNAMASRRARRASISPAAPKIRPPHGGYKWEEADPLTTFDVRRFNAIRGYQAQQGREIGHCLKELRLLRKEALARTDEPEDVAKNEPKSPAAPANDDAMPYGPMRENEPETDPWDALPAPVRAELERLLAADDWPRLAALGATGALRPLGLEPADLASPEALGRALFRPRAA